MEHLSSGLFRNRFVEHFAGDHSGDLRPRQTPGVLYALAQPTPVRQPQLLGWSSPLASILGIDSPDEQDLNVLAGNLVTGSMKPYAACYAGHQFGHWAGQLGDGRAITLGEWTTPGGELWELQLKGAGPTPYSRSADGRAVLRSSVREFLMSEAMHFLGIPTTRALALVSTGERVLRDMFYDGNPEYEPGAIVMRAAPSFLRFGNFEILASRRETENLRQLVEWTISQHYPHLEGEDRILRFYQEVVARTAWLMVEWVRVGFVHGVMNTDNMSILGLTIDYGPYSFVDNYDPDFTPNTTDLPGRRYAFGKQASIAKWNLACLAGALAPLFENTEPLKQALELYDHIYWSHFYRMMAGKLGLDEIRETDGPLISGLLEMLRTVKPDMTLFFRLLADHPADVSYLYDTLYETPEATHTGRMADWLRLYNERLQVNTLSAEESVRRMKAHNPRFILRNYLLHQAIEELENGKDTLFRKLWEALQHPYDEGFDEFFQKRPDWAAQTAGCSMLSCSS